MRHTFQDLHGIKGLSVEQEYLSPALPRDYVDASLPVAVVRLTIRNESDEPLLHGASLMLSWLNGDGSSDDVGGGMVHELLDEREAGVVGVAMHARRAQCTRDRDARLTVHSADRHSYLIGAETSADTEVTVCEEFRASDAADASTLWTAFSETGKVERVSFGASHGSEPGSALASAIAVYLPSLAVGETKEVVFVVARNSSLVRFGDGSAFRRRHAALFNASHAAVNRALLRLSMLSWRRWLSDIEAWQQPVLGNDELPLEYRRTLFNELYYLSVGGALWLASKEPVQGDYHVGLTDSVDTALENWQAARAVEATYTNVGSFLYMEGIEYAMYNTVDVHFYASFALVSNWPELNMSLLTDVADATLAHDEEVMPMLYGGGKCPRSVRAAVPHDLGSPSDHPWLNSNCYELHDTSRWLDLGPKFVLMVYRDYAASGDLAFAKRVWPAVEASMRHSSKFDLDEDALPDSYGRPDTTYDEACAVGAATYPAVLWVAAQAAAAALATALGETEKAAAFEEGRVESAAAVERLLWTGRYYRLDSSCIPKGTALEHSPIMSDALVGDLYCRVAGLPEAVPLANARRHLQTVRDLNVLRFGTGRQGAVNRMNPNGTVDTSSLQSAEVWTGSTFAVVAHMVLAGLEKEGMSTVDTFVHHLHSELPFLYNTPEALDGNDRYRSISYMRPLAIWAVQWAVDQRAREAGGQDTEDMT
jgi:non-lysosomal glucosylceramidase